MSKAKVKSKPAKTEAAESFVTIYRRAESPNATQADRAALRKWLERKPDQWRAFGDMTRQAQNRLIESANCNGAAKEIFAHSCDQLRGELAQDGDGALEKMLIDTIVLAWLRLGMIEQQYTNQFSNSITLTSGIYWEKRLSAAHKRFANATANLAKVRKLQRPKTKNQLSIAQINQYLNQTGNERPHTLGESIAAFSLRGLKLRQNDEPADLKQLSNAKAEQ